MDLLVVISSLLYIILCQAASTRSENWKNSQVFIIQREPQPGRDSRHFQNFRAEKFGASVKEKNFVRPPVNFLVNGKPWSSEGYSRNQLKKPLNTSIIKHNEEKSKTRLRLNFSATKMNGNVDFFYISDHRAKTNLFQKIILRKPHSYLIKKHWIKIIRNFPCLISLLAMQGNI